MLYLIRGVSGSGKTTLAKMIVAATGAEHYEADMYFYDENGNYNFEMWKLSMAHEWCFQNVKKALEDGKDVVVSNTFTRKWEFEKYVKLCREIGVPINRIECKSLFENVHNVDDETIKRQLDRWENV